MKVLLGYIYILFSFMASGQTTDPNDPEIYLQAMGQYLRYCNLVNHQTVDTLYIKYDFPIKDSIPNIFGGVVIVKVKEQIQLREILNRKKAIQLIKIYPLARMGETEQFFVKFVPFGCGYKKGTNREVISMLNGGSIQIIFRLKDNFLTFDKIEDLFI